MFKHIPIITKFLCDIKLKEIFCTFIFFSLALIPATATAKGRMQSIRKPDITPITVKSFKQIAIYQENQIPATVISIQESIISSEIVGTISKVNFLVGAKVKKGNSIAKIASDDYESLVKKIKSSIKAIKAEINLTEWQLTQANKLIKEDHVSQEFLKKYNSTLESLKAKLSAETESLKTAQLNVQRCNIKAPYNGVITERFVSIGEYVSVGRKIAKIVDTENLELDAKAHFHEIESIKTTTKMFFRQGNKKYPLILRTIVPKQDPKSLTQTVRLTFKNKKPIPGSAGKLVWQSEKPAIPPEYVRQIGKQYGIFIVKEGKAHFFVLDNAIEGQSVTIDKAIEYPIIIDGRYNVQNGDPVKIQK